MHKRGEMTILIFYYPPPQNSAQDHFSGVSKQVAICTAAPWTCSAHPFPVGQHLPGDSGRWTCTRWDLVGRDRPRGQGAHAADPLTSRCLNLLQSSESRQRLLPDTESNTKATLSHLPQISFSVLLPQALKSVKPHLSGGHVNFSQKLIK